MFGKKNKNLEMIINHIYFIKSVYFLFIITFYEFIEELDLNI